MTKVKVVTAFIPLANKTGTAFEALGKQLIEALPDKIWVFDDYPIEACQRYNLRTFPPATHVPPDRFDQPAQMTLSNIMLHERPNWIRRAAAECPDVDIFVWIDYGILKQGGWTGRPVLTDQIVDFVHRLEELPVDGIPFPAIWGPGPVSDTEISWRFVGSTVIFPRKYLYKMCDAYDKALMQFVTRTGTVPHDTTIWATVERQADPALPFRGYSANHDATQFTNYRGVVPLTPLCQLAEIHQTDKGPYHGYTPIYHELLNGRRESTRRVLEVGIGYAGRGHTPFWPFGASLKMWEEYFPNADIYGVDIAPEVMINQGRIHSALCDQSRASSLIDTAERLGGDFDLIVDDGSHELEHQILTANILLRYLKPDGIFVIEDVNMDPSQITRRLPPGYVVQAYRSHAEPAHAYLMVIRRS